MATALVLGAAAVGGLAACRGKTEDAERPTPSGLPIPRYVTLKFDPVNARAGPGDDHRLLWVYHAQGLPVQVVAETDAWRRICDSDGGLSWVHVRTTDGRRALLQQTAQPLPLRARPQDDAAVVAYLAPRAIAGFDRCEKGWCKVKVGGAAAWGPQSAFWGADDKPQCSKAAAP